MRRKGPKGGPGRGLATGPGSRRSFDELSLQGEKRGTDGRNGAKPVRSSSEQKRNADEAGGHADGNSGEHDDVILHSSAPRPFLTLKSCKRALLSFPPVTATVAVAPHASQLHSSTLTH